MAATRAAMKNPTMVRTIRAEQGTSMIVDRKRPVSEAVSDMTAEAVITEQKRRKNTPHFRKSDLC